MSLESHGSWMQKVGNTLEIKVQRSTKLCVRSLILSYDQTSLHPKTQSLELGKGGFCNCGDKLSVSLKLWCCTEHNSGMPWFTPHSRNFRLKLKQKYSGIQEF
jgi:hypothetical protein